MASRQIDGPDKEYLTLPEVAAFVRLSENTVRRLMEAGEFPRPHNPTGLPGGVKLWHWRAMVFWMLKVEMRPHLRVAKPGKKKTLPRGAKESH